VISNYAPIRFFIHASISIFFRIFLVKSETINPSAKIMIPLTYTSRRRKKPFCHSTHTLTQLKYFLLQATSRSEGVFAIHKYDERAKNRVFKEEVTPTSAGGNGHWKRLLPFPLKLLVTATILNPPFRDRYSIQFPQ